MAEERVKFLKGGIEGGGTEQKGKKTHAHGHQCGDCGGGESGVQGDYMVMEKIQ